MKTILIPFVHYTRNYLPKKVISFLEDIIEKENTETKYWWISAVLGFIFVISFINLRKT